MKRLVLLALLLAACAADKPAEAPKNASTSPPPPAALQARELIANSAELGEHQFTNASWTAPLAQSSMSAPVRAEAEQLARAGWIAIRNGEVALTEKSKSDKRFLLRENGLLDVVPLAKKEMGDVTAVRSNADGTVSATFTWKWLPNEVGAAFTAGPVHDRLAAPQRSTATLMWDGTAWTVLKIDQS